MSADKDELGLTAPTPQDYGFPANPSVVNQQCWDRQQAFLAAFGHLGTIRAAARTIGIHRVTVNSWMTADLYGFQKRMEDARQEYREFLEDLTHERLTDPQGNRGSDVLLMFRQKAEDPAKYREEVKVIGIEASKQMMDRLRELASKDRAAQVEQDASATEGQFQEVSSLPPPEPDPPGPAAQTGQPKSVEPIRPTVVSPDSPGQKERLMRQRRKSERRVTRR
jgi:hypothetical protein